MYGNRNFNGFLMYSLLPRPPCHFLLLWAHGMYSHKFAGLLPLALTIWGPIDVRTTVACYSEPTSCIQFDTTNQSHKGKEITFQHAMPYAKDQSFLPYTNILASSVRRNRYNSLAESGLEGCIYQGPGKNGK